MAFFDNSVSTLQRFEPHTDYVNLESCPVFNLSPDLTSADLIDPFLLVDNTLELPRVLNESNEIKNSVSARLESNESMCNEIQTTISPVPSPNLELVPDLVYDDSFENEEEELNFGIPGYKLSADVGETQFSMGEATTVPHFCGFDIFTMPPWKLDGTNGQLESTEPQLAQNESQPAFTFPVVKQSILPPIASPTILDISTDEFNPDNPEHISYATFSKNVPKDNFLLSFETASEVLPTNSVKSSPSFCMVSGTSTVNSLPTTDKHYDSYGQAPQSKYSSSQYHRTAESQARKNEGSSDSIDTTKVGLTALPLTRVLNSAIVSASIGLSTESSSTCNRKSKKGRPPVHGTDEERFAARRLANRKYYMFNKDKINKRRRRRKLESGQLASNEEMQWV